MSNVINLHTRDEFLTPELLLKSILEHVEDIKNIVVVIQRSDEMVEICHSQMENRDLTYSAACLQGHTCGVVTRAIDDWED